MIVIVSKQGCTNDMHPYPIFLPTPKEIMTIPEGPLLVCKAQGSEV